MRTKWLAIGGVLLLAIFVFGAAGLAADYYVATTGSDTTGNGSSGSPWQTIQHAIDEASSGDTINVVAGTYTEQVTITKSLNLIGAGEATTIIKAPSGRSGTVSVAAPSAKTWDYILAAEATSGTIDVAIIGFAFDAGGEAKQSGTDGLIGVLLTDVAGTGAGLYSCTITGFESTEYTSVVSPVNCRRT